MIIKWLKNALRLNLEHAYISPADRFLAEFDRKHPEKSPSQQKEIAKHARVAALRDQPALEKSGKSENSDIWQGF